MTFQISEKSKEYISKKVGMDYDSILSKSLTELRTFIESKIGKKINDPIEDSRLYARGSVYISQSRFIDYNTEEMNKQIDALK